MDAWEHPHTGKVYMLTINQEIYVPQLENHLLYPVQWIMNGVSINGQPKFLADNPDEANHTLQATGPLYNNYTLTSTFHIRGIST